MDFRSEFVSDFNVRSLTLVRHGRTAYNAAGRIQGSTDIPLDEVGDWQVRQSGKVLKRLYVDSVQDKSRRQLIVSSDLGRAMATAHAFADLIGEDVHPDPRVRERDYGDWEGESVAEIAKRYPEDFTSWVHGEGGELKHNVEPDNHVGQRSVQAIAEWARKADKNTDLYIFSHGACIADTIRTLLNADSSNESNSVVSSMTNAHWARLTPICRPNKPVRWMLSDYNHGPAIADTPEWENPAL